MHGPRNPVTGELEVSGTGPYLVLLIGPHRRAELRRQETLGMNASAFGGEIYEYIGWFMAGGQQVWLAVTRQ